ncbi:60S ribosomal protein L19 (nucleomorph) [Cryptomonas paramecium]|uniref:60S ribosomal protein L19 n=1 Tax=Cryptomonas paramaecium TaxID=2898 RepID=F2HID8_9CRYP|nr:60S ribosomal protein L19 [Cryptomonas paramecium]AEA39062.1 60S ribosomal protein L19 [Cryptomonas paramecium]|mmetsp:Transcript_16866/g.46108  ORF Transcript_16866/g.46108 Transcript_16866/m.46108 type:complete len:153 (-) Transcript_16866:1727-2185(-)
MDFQKKVASQILGCGKRKVWIDPNEKKEILLSNNRVNIIKMIKRGHILKKNVNHRSNLKFKIRKESSAKGRHHGVGKKKGTSNARFSMKTAWIVKQRVLRNLLKKYKCKMKINRHLYRNLYKKCKGNIFKNKRILVEYINKFKLSGLKNNLK